MSTPSPASITRGRRFARGLTLLELVASILIMSVISASVFPVIASAADAYASATRARKDTERIAFALERCIRLLREAEGTTPVGGLDITTAQTDRIVFADGRGLSLSGTDLYYLESGQPDSPLCRDVTLFRIDYISDDGIKDAIGDPTTTQRFNITLTTGGMTLTGSAFARARIGD